MKSALRCGFLKNLLRYVRIPASLRQDGGSACLSQVREGAGVLEKLLQRRGDILVAHKIFGDNLCYSVRLDTAVGMVRVLHFADFGPVVNL